jgi:hypothetical protein
MIKLNSVDYAVVQACLNIVKEHPELWKQIEDYCSNINLPITSPDNKMFSIIKRNILTHQENHTDKNYEKIIKDLEKERDEYKRKYDLACPPMTAKFGPNGESLGYFHK